MPQKILIVNKFFYPRGGDCVHTINLVRLLESKGHEVAVFAMEHSENLPTRWADYFPSEVEFAGAKRALPAVRRVFGGANVQANFKRLLDDFQPDVVHLQNIHSQLSPVVAKLAYKRKIRVVWTLHDYKLLCPAYSCLCRGEVCERCYTRKQNVVFRRCLKGSLAASAIAYAEALMWRREQLQEWTHCFICPSAFMRKKMSQGGFKDAKLNVLCNFVSSGYSQVALSLSTEEQAYAYVGRISKEKGIETLLRVAATLPHTLYVAGHGDLTDELRAQYAEHKQIVWLGQLTPDEVRQLFARVRFSVVPSECYENNPLSLIESLCTGTPVLGARIGGIPELINEKENGVTFEAMNGDDLRQGIIYLFENRLNSKQQIQDNALQLFSPDRYYDNLIRIYTED